MFLCSIVTVRSEQKKQSFRRCLLHGSVLVSDLEKVYGQSANEWHHPMMSWLNYTS